MLLAISAFPSKGSEQKLAQSVAIHQSLQEALNKKDVSSIKKFLATGNYASTFIYRYNKFLEAFPNATWKIQRGKPLQDGSEPIEVTVNGSKNSDGRSYILEAKQLLSINTYQGKIVTQEILSEQSVIQSGEKHLSIDLNIPDTVLTGTNYDIDLILIEPLESTILAGGLISLSQNEINDQLSPSIDLEPLASGGLFKSVKAPLQPGIQNWAAIIAHPKGLISITKMVRVVNTAEQITL